MICGAEFKKSDSHKKLKEHKKTCSKDNPFYDDDNADSYDEWIRGY